MKSRLLFIFLICLSTTACFKKKSKLEDANYRYTLLNLDVIDHSGKNFTDITSDTILKTAFGIQLKLAIQHDKDPDEDYDLNPIDPVAKVEILTLTPFNSSYPVNSNLVELFRDFSGNTQYEEITIDAFNLGVRAEMNCMLIEAPTTSGWYQFQVILTLESGIIIQDTTQTIYLK